MIYQAQPLEDPRWADLAARHPRASVFHTVAWLEALHRTYGYRPVAFTTSAPGEVLKDGIVLCEVASWITGRRMVSLPFSDHCEPLVASAGDEGVFAAALQETLHREKLAYIELRPRIPLTVLTGSRDSGESYCLHELDLRPDAATLFSNCHRDSVQRKIRRARREGLVSECGRSATLLDAFWDLLVMTRRRHHVPPQPKQWFRNLIDRFGDSLQIRVARKDGQPAAAILTLRHRETLVYKYGASDRRFNRLGGMQLLLWEAIEGAKRAGLRTLDLGRSDWDNTGLITFKDRWGGTRSSLTYSRLSASEPSYTAGDGWVVRVAKQLIPHAPNGVLRLAGRMVYRHIG